jgi:hypothetical protein
MRGCPITQLRFLIILQYRQEVQKPATNYNSWTKYAQKEELAGYWAFMICDTLPMIRINIVDTNV